MQANIKVSRLFTECRRIISGNLFRISFLLNFVPFWKCMIISTWLFFHDCDLFDPSPEYSSSSSPLFIHTLLYNLVPICSRMRTIRFSVRDRVSEISWFTSRKQSQHDSKGWRKIHRTIKKTKIKIIYYYFNITIANNDTRQIALLKPQVDLWWWLYMESTS